MAEANLSRDVAYLDLVSDLKGEVAGFADHARSLVEATGAGTVMDAERALAVLNEHPQAAYQWDRPLTRQDRENRKACYDAQVAAAESTMCKLLFGTTVAQGMEGGGTIGMFGVIASGVLSTMGSIMWHGNLGTVLLGTFAGSLLSWGGCCAWGVRQAARNAKAHGDLPRRVAQVKQRLRDEAPVDLDPADARRWLSVPEVAAQARHWAKSAPGLMAEDVRLLDKRWRELQHAQDRHEAALTLNQILG